MNTEQVNTRGKAKLCSLTYELLAEWTGLTEGTIRNAASRGDFDRNSLTSTLEWANAKRARRGLLPIGIPTTERTQPHRAPQPIIPDPNYNPLTAEYRYD